MYFNIKNRRIYETNESENHPGFINSGIFGLALMSSIAPQKPWDIPAKFKTMKNPKSNDAASVAAGKDLWNKNCASCHGKQV